MEAVNLSDIAKSLVNSPGFFSNDKRCILLFQRINTEIACHHMCYYDKPVNQQDVELLKKELKEDPDLMQDLDFDKTIFAFATKKEMYSLLYEGDLPDSILMQIKEADVSYTDT